MRRILFVDDQESALQGHRESMDKYREQLDLVFANGGDAALEVVRSTEVDVIVSNMHMANMDGRALLGTIKEDFPNMVRIMLVPLSNTDAVFSALTVSHQVLNKPIDPETLLNGIERTCKLRSLLTDALRRKIGGVEKLPSVPAVYKELMAAMADPDVTTAKIARIVERDAAMAAKTLQLVNSTCFSFSRSISSLDHAVAFLGLELMKNLCLAVQVFAAFEGAASRIGISFDAEQEHARVTAKIARRLLANPQQAQNAFTAGLLHDIGNLVLAVCIPNPFKEVIRECKASGRPTHEVEAEMLGMTHAEVGAYLLGLWGLPLPIVEAVAFHHVPGAALEKTFDIPSAVSLANALVDDMQGVRPLALHSHLESLKVIHNLPDWIEIAKEELQQAERAGLYI